MIVAARAGLGGTSTAVPVQLERSSHAAAKVTLIRPPVTVPVDTFAYVAPMPPIGLAYVAAALREAGHDITVVDGPGEAPEQTTDFDAPIGTMFRIGLTFEEIVERIPPGTQLVGISHMFLHDWPTVRELATLVKRKHPDAFLVLGGENATAYRKWIFEETPAVDACVLGEGEATAVELAGRIAAGAPLTDMRGIALRDADRTTPEGAGQLPVRIRSLTTIPRPAWDLFPMENYLDFHEAIGEERSRSMPMLATRGCPYKCSFCSSPQMWTTRYQVREPEELVDEIADYVDRYGIDSVNFVDLTAITKHDWTLAFCDALEARGLGIKWDVPVGTRSEGLDEHVIQRLKDSGCHQITLAPEHGSQHMLEVFDKRVDLDHIFTAIRAAKKVGVSTHVNTVIGHPAETWGDRWKNYVFLVRTALAGATTGAAYIFHPYPGSRDFQEIVDAGLLTVDDTYVYDGLAIGTSGNRSWNPKVSERSLFLTHAAMKLTFELVALARDPRRAVRVARAFFESRTDTIGDANLRDKAAGPVGLRFSDVYNQRLFAMWVRWRMRARKEDRAAASADAGGPEQRHKVGAAR